MLAGTTPKQGFTSLPAKGRTAAAPKWPLPADAKTTALRDLAQDQIAPLTAELEGAEDGRTKGRLRRQLVTADAQSGPDMTPAQWHGRAFARRAANEDVT